MPGPGRYLKQGGVDPFSLEYVSDTETDVTDGLGHVTRYTFDKSKGRHVVTRVEGVQLWWRRVRSKPGNDEQLNVTDD